MLFDPCVQSLINQIGLLYICLLDLKLKFLGWFNIYHLLEKRANFMNYVWIKYIQQLKMKKKFTIFGHSGFLGKNIVDFLEKNNFRYFLPKRDKYVFKDGIFDIGKRDFSASNTKIYIKKK